MVLGVDRYVIVPATDKTTIEKVIKTIDDLHEALNNPEVLNMYKELSKQYEESKLTSKSKGLHKALKKCLVSHRFTDAAKMMECLSCVNGNSQLIFKGGFQVLENHPDVTPERMLHFMRHILSLKCLFKSEVALEAAIYFIKRGNFPEAQSCIQEIETASWRRVMRTDPLIGGLLTAYHGLLIYIEWAKLKLSVNNDNIEDKEQKMKTLSDKAISVFSGLLQQNGPWDIFVVKLIEVLEYYGKLNEAENALIQYKETNPLHIHAHIYLYDFYQKHNYEQEKKMQCLQKIVEMCPSDSRTLDYVLIAKEKEMKKCIDMIFTYLNYASNKNDLKAWAIFVELLLHALQQNDRKECKILKNIWHQYRSYWPLYQFSPESITLTDEKAVELCMLKATAVCTLEDTKEDHPFVCEVQKALDSLPFSDLKSKLSHNLFLIKKLKSRQRRSKKRKLSTQDNCS